MKILLKRVIQIFLTTLISAEVVALPTVEGVDLVSSKRLSRTVFEYGFALRIRGDSSHHKNIHVSISEGGQGTIITKSLVKIGNIDAESFVKTNDLLIVQHDRSFKFEPAKFQYNFLTTDPSPTINDQSLIQVGAVRFFELAGRRGHRGSFQLQTENPRVGAKNTLKAKILGSINHVQARLIDSDGQVLQTSSMISSMSDASGETYEASLLIPQQPFYVSLQISTLNGEVVDWIASTQTKPSEITLKMNPRRVILSKGEEGPVSILFNSGNMSGPFIVSLTMPLGFAGYKGPWTIDPSPGKDHVINTSIISPQIGDLFDEYTISVHARPLLGSTNEVTSNLKFIVR